MAKEIDYNVDRRKFDVGDTLKYRNEKGEVKTHKVYAVRFKEDVDHIRHDYEYIMDIEDWEWAKRDNTGEIIEYGDPLYCIVNSTEILEKL